MNARTAFTLWILLGVTAVSGCSTAYRISIDEARRMSDPRFSKVVYPSAIQGVLLTPEAIASLPGISDTMTVTDSAPGDNRQIEFMTGTGNINLRDRVVTGIDSAGDSVSIRFDQILYIGFKNTGLALGFMSPREVESAIEAGLSDPLTEVKRGQIPFWDVISFANNGGHIDKNRGMVIGRNKEDNLIQVDLSDIRYLEYREFNLYKTLRFGLSTATVALFVKGYLDVM